eukprot:155951-Pelagomonas_calceolata.AAC.4
MLPRQPKGRVPAAPTVRPCTRAATSVAPPSSCPPPPAKKVLPNPSSLLPVLPPDSEAPSPLLPKTLP